MFKFLKWGVIGTVAAAAGGFLLFGSHVGSYLGTAASQIRQGITESIPIEFELKRAASLVHEIEPQLHEAKREVAQAVVDLERLRSEVEDLERRVEAGEHTLRADSAALAKRGTGHELASYSHVRSSFELERTFESFKTNTALLKGKRELIERQERAVLAARARLDAVRTEKSRLEDMIAALTTQKRLLDAQAASSESLDIDDSALGRARDVLDEIKNRLDVAQQMLEDEAFGATEIVVTDRDIAAEVQAWLAEHDRGTQVLGAR